MFKQLIKGTIAISSEWYDNKYIYKLCSQLPLKTFHNYPSRLLNILWVNENSRNRANLASLSHCN